MAEKKSRKNVATRESGDVQETAAGDTSRERLFLRPPVDIWEDGENITLQMDMPGVSRDRLTIQAAQDSLLVEGSAQIDVPAEIEALYADVRSTQYRRSFVLSRELDAEKIDAALRDGVLTLQIPKREEVRARKIAVRAE
jgi:HSP20 family molecular chaperone IbpA